MNINQALVLIIAVVAAAPLWAAQDGSATGKNLGNVVGGDFKKAHAVIEKRCTVCHSDKRIDAALSSGKDMATIQQEMEKRGAKLNANEREVLGIYWKQNPLKK
ncbi:cytochrome C [Oryzomonas sagensis]|uniref:Cytochrome C n=1 Tax=Oryzomonas sagensis TaxID=2603857 RepID=A0ABQ6TQ61_9BACT|nr:cytochrome C [Oryzomonas sagensis]KAB0671077.1 cytochrome C [Oryzomonas sagensis]